MPSWAFTFVSINLSWSTWQGCSGNSLRSGYEKKNLSSEYSVHHHVLCTHLLKIPWIHLPFPKVITSPLVQDQSVKSLSRVRLFVTPWTAGHQASLSITNSRSLPKLMSIESLMPSNHLILCRPLLLLPSIFTSIRVFSNESALCIRWPKYQSFSFNTSPSKEHSVLIFSRMVF